MGRWSSKFADSLCLPFSVCLGGLPGDISAPHIPAGDSSPAVSGSKGPREPRGPRPPRIGVALLSPEAPGCPHAQCLVPNTELITSQPFCGPVGSVPLVTPQSHLEPQAALCPPSLMSFPQASSGSSPLATPLLGSGPTLGSLLTAGRLIVRGSALVISLL